ncbi:MAG: phosphatidylserine decarboxylase [Alphaproteobacteria bacterium]
MNRYSIPSIHPAGWPFIGLFAAATVVLALIAKPLGWLGVLATAWCVFFFRDPDRVPPEGADLVLSPADGFVQAVTNAVPPQELDMDPHPRRRVSIFLDIFDVHVNRAPAAGTILRLSYRPGKFFNASLDKASEFNERMSILLATRTGHEIAFVQIAGLVARRIVCDLKPEQTVMAGERFGMIRFGSRLDVYLPDDARLFARRGQRMIAGQSVIAQMIPAGEHGVGPE